MEKVSFLGQTVEKPRWNNCPVGQFWTLETLKSLEQKPKEAFRLSLGNSLEKLLGGKPKVCTPKSQTAARGI